VYINGVQVGIATSMAYPRSVQRSTNFLGRSNWEVDTYLNGGIKDFRMYNRVLSAAEVTTCSPPPRRYSLEQANAKNVQLVSTLQLMGLLSVTYALLENPHISLVQENAVLAAVCTQDSGALIQVR
jgi:hypothetical protein